MSVTDTEMNIEAHAEFIAPVTFTAVKPHGKVIGYKAADGKILIVKNLAPKVVQKYTVFYDGYELDIVETLAAAKQVGINAHKTAVFALI